MEFFAKFTKEDGKLIGTTTLIEHSINVGVVSSVLLTKTKYKKLLTFFSDYMNCSEEMAYNFLVLFCSLHDVGKIHPYFQAKESNSLEYLKKECFLTLLEYRGLKNNGVSNSNQYKIRHEVFSKKILKEYYKIKNDNFNTFLSVIGLHHEKYNVEDLGKEPKNRKEFWYSECNKVIKVIEDVFDFSLNNLSYNNIVDIDVLCFLLLGLLETSDWIGSSPYYNNSHSLFLSCSNLNEYKEKQLERSIKIINENLGMKENNILFDTEYSRLFGVDNPKLRGVQECMIDVVPNKKFILIEAPMGEGKTEAALYSAGKMSENLNFFYALPTSATTDSMYNRVKTMFNKQMLTNLNVLHSSSFLIDKLYKEDIEDFYNFLNSTKTGLFVDNCIGTVDQVMLSVMKVKFSALRLLGLLNKVIIIDEVHAYDCYMSEILSSFLKWANKLQIPVIMLSATLPIEKRKKLIESYLNKEIQMSLSSDYPLITSIDLNENILETKVDKVEMYKKFNYKLLQDRNCIYSLVKNKLQEGKNVGIVVNTINDSQILYKDFEIIGIKNIFCLNGAKMLKDRVESETKIINSLGKINRAKGMLVIGTQILEQSLDIDFDSIIVVICPADLLFQRIGRYNRFNILNREIESNVYVLVDDESLRSAKKVYHPLLIDRTYTYIKENELCLLPQDFRKTIEYVYNEDYNDTEKEILIDYLVQNDLNRDLGKLASYLGPQENEFQRDVSSNIFMSVDEDLGSYGTRLGEESLRVCLLSDKKIFEIGEENLKYCENKEMAKFCIENSLSIRFSKLFKNYNDVESLILKGTVIECGGFLKGYYVFKMKEINENNFVTSIDNNKYIYYNRDIGLQVN